MLPPAPGVSTPAAGRVQSTTRHPSEGFAMSAASSDRRGFLRTAGALSLSAAGYASAGASDRLGVAVVGCGARGQAHLHRLLARPDVAVVGVCDVWDGLDDEFEVTANGRGVRRRYR